MTPLMKTIFKTESIGAILKGLDLTYRNDGGLKTSPSLNFDIVIVGSDNFVS